MKTYERGQRCAAAPAVEIPNQRFALAWRWGKDWPFSAVAPDRSTERNRGA
jgi:hypothetical protein